MDWFCWNLVYSGSSIHYTVRFYRLSQWKQGNCPPPLHLFIHFSHGDCGWFTAPQKNRLIHYRLSTFKERRSGSYLTGSRRRHSQSLLGFFTQGRSFSFSLTIDERVNNCFCFGVCLHLSWPHLLETHLWGGIVQYLLWPNGPKAQRRKLDLPTGLLTVMYFHVLLFFSFICTSLGDLYFI